jgi:hypothetical protein
MQGQHFHVDGTFAIMHQFNEHFVAAHCSEFAQARQISQGLRQRTLIAEI